MPLLCFDLDNTLVNRTAGFRAWAIALVDELGLDPHELAWLMELDLDGFARRELVFAAIRDRYGLDRSVEDINRDYRATVARVIETPPGTHDALVAARDAGWSLWVVTNGDSAVQVSKIEGAGLADILEGWVISDDVGVRKPDPQIFEMTAARAGVDLTGAWMVGDHSSSDIAGAVNAGIDSVWIDRRRAWDETHYRPTAVAPDVAAAVWLILDGGTGTP